MYLNALRRSSRHPKILSALGALGLAPEQTFTQAELDALGPNLGWSATTLPGQRTTSGGYTDTFGVFHPTYTTGPSQTWWTAPAWFTNRASITPYVNTANPVAVYGVSLPNGMRAYWVANSWMLNEGVQKLPASVASSYGGIELPRNAATITGGVDNGFLFKYDPSHTLPTGLPSGQYTPGVNVGKRNIMTAATIAAGAGAILAAPAAFSTLFAAQAPLAVAPGAYAAAGGAPVVESAGEAALVPSAETVAAGGAPAIEAAPAIVTSGAGTGTTGLVASAAPIVAGAKTAAGIVGAIKTLMSLAQRHATQASGQQASAQSAYDSGLYGASNQLLTQASLNQSLAQQYQDQAHQLALDSGIAIPGVGTLPLWLLLLGAFLLLK